jgi:putative PIG3 family NAD(P)H quinone oxidoreductase
MRGVLPTAAAGDVPQVGEMTDPRPGPGEVLVRVAAAGLNRADLLQLRGHYPPPPGESLVPGLECAGTIIECSADAGDWAVGTRVMALVAGGGQAELAAIPAGQLMALPEVLSFEEGGALPEAALTAWTNLVAEGQLTAGETVLITGATGGIGSFAIQLARELGATVIATARHRERLARLAELGIENWIVDDASLPQRVADATGGRGADLVLDLVGGEAMALHLEALRRGGRLILLGVLAGGEARVDLAAFLRRRLRLIGSTLRARPRPEKAALVQAFVAFAGPRLADGRLRAVVDRVMPLAEAPVAYAALAAGGSLGKVVLSFS